MILVPEIGGPTASDSVLDILCFGDSTGQIHISADGISHSYIHGSDQLDLYTWRHFLIYNLDTGLYSVIVTDNINCNTTLDSIMNI